ncbi:MAG: NAD(P)/FAD-dependent oxidoreductase [Balneolaceae bacterium]|nr:NAD(P)/FAD-dependent oxidoreductase [Balneolaceae bacterium]MDR9407961.1 NAD(P)/FAD-dependent oxidoreductase [Balneolaceae bacterium]
MGTSRKTVIIVGGGFGGIAAAKSLKNTQYNVILIDKKNHHLFQPLLYQVATAALSPGDIAMPIRGIFGNYDNIRTVMDKVVEINKETQTIQLETGDSLNFDFLILAPGAQYNYFGNKDWADHAPGLKTLDNALEIREKILISLEKADQISDKAKRKPYLRYVVVGAGPTGVETAGAIAEIAKRNMMRDFKSLSPAETEVYLVEAADGVLNGYPENLSKRAQKDLEKMGVNVLLNSPVTDIREDGIEIEERFIKTPNMVWAAGVKASPLIEALDCDIDKMGRAIVNEHLTIPGSNNIFVIGDAAHSKDEDGNPLPGLAPVALQMGRYVGDLIKKEIPIKDSKAFHYVDKGTMATIGRAKAVAEVRGFTFSGLIAWLLWCFIHIFFLIGFRNRFRVFAEWSWYYITFKRGVRLITGRSSNE